MNLAQLIGSEVRGRPKCAISCYICHMPEMNCINCKGIITCALKSLELVYTGGYVVSLAKREFLNRLLVPLCSPGVAIKCEPYS